jgi:hypothetical protein
MCWQGLKKNEVFPIILSLVYYQARRTKTMSELKKKAKDKKSPSVALHQTDMGGKDIAKTKKKKKDKGKKSPSIGLHQTEMGGKDIAKSKKTKTNKDKNIKKPKQP